MSLLLRTGSTLSEAATEMGRSVDGIRNRAHKLRKKHGRNRKKPEQQSDEELAAVLERRGWTVRPPKWLAQQSVGECGAPLGGGSECVPMDVTPPPVRPHAHHGPSHSGVHLW